MSQNLKVSFLEQALKVDTRLAVTCLDVLQTFQFSAVGLLSAEEVVRRLVDNYHYNPRYSDSIIFAINLLLQNSYLSTSEGDNPKGLVLLNFPEHLKM